MLAGAAVSTLPAASKTIPLGLELYSVREELKQDLMSTVKRVAAIGYQGVEFYAPYTEWTVDYARQVRKLLDDLGIKCFSCHTGSRSFTEENLPHAIELNTVIGSKYIIMSSAGKVENLDGWKKVAEKLNWAEEKMKSAGLRTGFHNHQTEWKPVEGTRPMDVLAKNTGKSVTLQLDVGTALEAGVDPVAWINANPGRIRSLHLKDWSPQEGYRVLFGEGAAPWKKIFDAAEKKGGAEYYLIEQEGSRFAPFETVEKCLASYKKLRS
jgi:sugar phosphate isomerase/epimerase